MSYRGYKVVQSWRDLKPKFQSIEKHCIFGWLWHFSACEAELRGLISWHVWVVTCCHWRRICPYKLHKCLWIKKKTNVWAHKMDSPKRFLYVFLFASSDLRLQEDRPCMCQLFSVLLFASLGWRTKPDVCGSEGRGPRVANHDRSHFPTIFQRCHQKPLMNDLKYFKESQKYKFSISHTSLLIPIWPGLSITSRHISLRGAVKW